MNKFNKIILILILFSQSYSFGQSDGSIKEKIEEAHKIAQEFLEKEQIPGMSISVTKNGNLIWSEGFGFSNLEKHIKVSSRSTQFRIASISKSITAVALAKLVDDHKLNFDESIYTYIPDFPKKEI